MRFRCWWAGAALLLLALTFGAAAQQLSPAPRQQPTLAQARALVQAGRFAESAEALQMLLPAQPDNAEGYTLLAYALLRANRPAQSLEAYTHAASLRTPSATDLRNVAQDYALLDDFADADKWIRRAVAFDPRDADSWYSQGRIQYTEQLFAQAVASFQRALELTPQNVKTANNLGLAYEGLNDNAHAEAAYRQALAWQQGLPLRQRSEQPLLNLSIILLHDGRMAEAEPLLLEAAAIAPAYGPVHEQLGHLYLQQSRYAQAADQLELAIKASPNAASLHFLLGQAYRKAGQKTLAEREFALATRLTSAPKQN